MAEASRRVVAPKKRPAPGAYNPPLLFLVALIAFCLGILNGIFGVLDKADKEPAKSLGYVLIWISVTAALAACSAIVIQVQKFLAEKEDKNPEGTAADKAAREAENQQALRAARPLIIACMAVPVLSGTLAVLACIRIGLNMVADDRFLAVLSGGFLP